MPPSPRRALAGPRRLALACLPAGAAYAAVMASGMWLNDPLMQGGWRQWLVLAWIYGWPAVVTGMFAAASDARSRAAWVGVYMAGYGVVLLPVAATQGMGLALSLLGSWALINLVGTLLVAVVSVRRVRSAGPLVLALLLAMAFTAQGLLALLLDTAPGMAVTLPAGGTLGLSSSQMVGGVTLLGLGLGAAACWPLLHWLGRRYAARSFSDQSLLIDALFSIFAVTHTIGPGVDDGRWYLLGLAAFVAYRAVLALQRSRRTQPASGPSLLLLRVFRLGPRSEALFDRLRRFWLPQGPLRMISAPDLAAAAVAPHELLDWFTGRLTDHFVGDGPRLTRRLAQLHAGPDPDGRFRVDSVFCRDSSWRDAVIQLAARSDAVLMDLRGYGRDNKGCEWEIEQLLQHVPLQRVLLLVDTSTDLALLRATLDTAAAALDPASPNIGFRAGPVRLMTIGEASDRVAASICGLLLETTVRATSRISPAARQAPATASRGV